MAKLMFEDRKSCKGGTESMSVKAFPKAEWRIGSDLSQVGRELPREASQLAGGSPLLHREPAFAFRRVMPHLSGGYLFPVTCLWSSEIPDVLIVNAAVRVLGFSFSLFFVFFLTSSLVPG
jgi:hypothetical protein